ncbi:MAG: N-acetyltransferase, partial [Bacteroidales bacterium]|nr:N-acetyltransferase [Bacteroidales bacterium]
LSLLDLKFVSVIVDSQDQIVGFGVMMPSIVRALQKNRGKLFPFGWWHLVKSMYLKHEDNLELLLIGVTPEYQKKGVHALIFCEMFETAIKVGFTYAETNAELEDNLDVQTLWGDFDYEQHKRRRAYTKKI